MIYVIRITNTNFYKIGVTADNNPQRRLIALQTGSPYIMSIYCTCMGSNSMEFAIHRALSEYHYRGEWFELPINIAKRLVGLFDELDRLGRLDDGDIREYLFGDTKKVKEMLF